MAEILNTRESKQRNRVDVTVAYEIEYWCTELGCTEAQLREVVTTHGDSVEAVRQALKRQGGANFMESDG